MGMHRQPNVRGIPTHLDRERHFGDQLAGIGTDDATAEQSVRGRIKYQLGETLLEGDLLLIHVRVTGFQ
jgi:hypothetical protein